MQFSHRKGFIDRQAYIAQYVALAIFVMGITSTLGMDDLLAAFAAGMDTPWMALLQTRSLTSWTNRLCRCMGRKFQGSD
jgi:hypothetical protein